MHLTDGIIYLKAELDTTADVIRDKITFSLKGDYFNTMQLNNMKSVMSLSFSETRLVHSETSLELAENASVPLLVISPSHGKVKYKWEQRKSFMGDWEVVKVPHWTCLLYVTSANQYRCTVETSTIIFDVKKGYLSVANSYTGVSKH